MIGIGIANSLGLNRVSGINPDAQAFITAAGITGTTEVNAVNALVNGLQTDGLWSKMKAVYPFVTDNRNLLGYTEDFSNAFWTKVGGTITADSITAPNGTLTADKLTISGTGYHGIERNLSDSTNIRKIHSTYLKQDTNVRYFELIFGNVSDGAIFDLQTGTVTATAAGVTSVITNVGNGWYRCSISGIVNYAYPSVYANSTGAFGGSTNSLSGSFYIWGSQFEYTALTTYQPIATTQQAYIASQFKYNLKDPRDLDAAFRLVFNGGWTHSSTGATPNGTNGYADTKLVPSSVLTLNSVHLSFYSRTQTPNTLDQPMRSNDLLGDLQISPNINSGGFAFYASAGGSTGAVAANTDCRGLFISSRITSASLKGYKNNSILATNTTSGVNTLPNYNMYLAAANVVGSATNYSKLQTAFSTIGDGLSDTEAANLYTRVQNFQNSLNRAV